MFISLQHDDFTLVINEQLFQYLQIHLPPDLVIMHEFKLIKLKKQQQLILSFLIFLHDQQDA